MGNCWPLKTMPLEWEGPAKCMIEKYGSRSLKQLQNWNKLGFPTNGSFSKNQVSQLEKRLQEYEGKGKKQQVDWRAFGMWKEEVLLRESEQRIHLLVNNQIKERFNHGQFPKIDLLTDGPYALPQSPPPPNAQPTAPPIIQAPPTNPPPASTSQSAVPGWTTESNETPSSPPISSRTRRIEEKPVLLAPMVECPNPRAGTEGAPATVLVYRPYKMQEFVSLIATLPDPVTLGGAVFCKDLKRMIEMQKPTITELNILLPKIFGLKWIDVKKEFPEEGAWADSDAAYRDHINTLMESITAYFPIRLDWRRVKDCKQGKDESCGTYLTRLSEIFRLHCGISFPTAGIQGSNEDSGYEQHLKNSYLEGLKPEISNLVEISCMGLELERLDVVHRHASHAEKQVLRRRQNEKIKADRTQHELQMAQLQAIQNPTPDRDYNQERQRGKGWGPSRGREREHSHGAKHRGNCYFCGKYGHFMINCPERHGNRGWDSDATQNMAVQTPTTWRDHERTDYGGD